jgi:hypothetical protein
MGGVAFPHGFEADDEKKLINRDLSEFCSTQPS